MELEPATSCVRGRSRNSLHFFLFWLLQIFLEVSFSSPKIFASQNFVLKRASNAAVVQPTQCNKCACYLLIGSDIFREGQGKIFSASKSSQFVLLVARIFCFKGMVGTLEDYPWSCKKFSSAKFFWACLDFVKPLSCLEIYICIYAWYIHRPFGLRPYYVRDTNIFQAMF